MSKLNKKVGEKIKERRKTMAISQEKLADLANYHRTYIGAIERGERNITLETLEKISKVLNVQPEELIK
jgi:transcriptional regulator with XRE-family HTH domain